MSNLILHSYSLKPFALVLWLHALVKMSLQVSCGSLGYWRSHQSLLFSRLEIPALSICFHRRGAPALIFFGPLLWTCFSNSCHVGTHSKGSCLLFMMICMLCLLTNGRKCFHSNPAGTLLSWVLHCNLIKLWAAESANSFFGYWKSFRSGERTVQSTVLKDSRKK